MYYVMPIPEVESCFFFDFLYLQRISADVSSLTGDPSTQFNLKQIIESLSRLVME